MMMAVGFVIIAVLIALYLKLFLVARKHAAAIAAMTVAGETTHSTHKTDHHALRYTRTVMLIVGANSSTWMPMGNSSLYFIVIFFNVDNFESPQTICGHDWMMEGKERISIQYYHMYIIDIRPILIIMQCLDRQPSWSSSRPLVRLVT
jgi:hypothetical protein